MPCHRDQRADFIRPDGAGSCLQRVSGFLTNTLLCFDDDVKLYLHSITLEQHRQYERQCPEKNIFDFIADVYRL